MSAKQSMPKEFTEALIWHKTKDAIYPFHYMNDDDIDFKIRINDFPEEPLYTLLKEGEALMSFNDWPDNWQIHQN